jgi:5-methylthioadenosine/S-adenosylhomocysteine deaminase
VSLLITNAVVVTMNDAYDIVHGDVWMDDGRIVAIGRAPDDARPAATIDAEGGLVLPGFIQTHIHLCQTLFRGAADDLPLLAWLRERVWPLEAAHDAATLRAAARLAAAELLMGGTTSVLTMETVHDTHAVFEALAPTGLRAVVGKCLMDVRGEAPARLWQSVPDAIDEAAALHAHWHGAADGRLRAALAPRFAISCSPALLEAAAALSIERRMLIHTHASEQREEIAVVRARTGLDNVAYLASVGLATERLCAAHCVWVTDAEQQLIAERGIKVLHCPGSNLKLGSGIAPVREMRARGISVSLGADGAACNNALDMFQEMRLAATLQAMRHGPGALTARDAVWMATREGARALGQQADIGSIEPGKCADVIVLGAGAVHQQPAADPYSTIVYASRASDVRATIVGGDIVWRDGELAWAEPRALAEDAARARAALRERAGV